ncbi:hypothetical protein DSO57_1015996 [Entomophthora muscae]|uniref:Uncharacterized protein n=1 Tax=Entomophthora muscae TaxID=34485 RepID=A0ACC2SU51_9FUNG|nr:hypothetical protein DSO57_1015996 [Entomophthora muscae]
MLAWAETIYRFVQSCTRYYCDAIKSRDQKSIEYDDNEKGVSQEKVMRTRRVGILRYVQGIPPLGWGLDGFRRAGFLAAAGGRARADQGCREFSDQP